MRTITIIGKDRPALFDGLLESLAANDLAGWRVVIRIEPGDVAAQFEPIARRRLPAADIDFAINDRVLGIQGNSFTTVRHAFDSGSALNLYLEEDFVVAPDALALALWYEANHQPHWLCLSLLAGVCGSAALLSDTGHPDALVETRSFNSIGFALRREEWLDCVREAWRIEYRGILGLAAWRHNWSWDWSLYGLVAGHATRRTLQPLLARANHTGRVGTFAKPAFHDIAFSDLPMSTGPASYRVVDPATLPQPVRSLLLAQKELTDMRLQLEDEALMTQASLPRFAAKRLRRWWKRRIRRERDRQYRSDF